LSEKVAGLFNYSPQKVRLQLRYYVKTQSQWVLFVSGHPQRGTVLVLVPPQPRESFKPAKPIAGWGNLSLNKGWSGGYSPELKSWNRGTVLVLVPPQPRESFKPAKPIAGWGNLSLNKGWTGGYSPELKSWNLKHTPGHVEH
jgi:hypothetical protein